MQYNTHVITSVTAAVALLPVDSVSLTVVTIGGVAFGSLLPDIDEPNSYIGKKTRILSKFTNSVFRHRGFTHSIPAIVLAFIPWYMTGHPSDQNIFMLILSSFLFGVGLGYGFHIVGDLFSKTGVPLFSPFSKDRIKIPIYKTGGMMETCIRYSSIVCFWYLVLAKALE